MLEFSLVEDLRHIHACKVALEKGEGGVDVAGFHEAQARGGGYIGEFVADDLPGFGAAVGERREANVIELFPVDGAVEVAGCGDRCGKE